MPLGPFVLTALIAGFARPADIELFQQSVSSSVQNLEAQISEGQRLIDEGKFAAALSALREAVEESERLGDDRLLASSLRRLAQAQWGVGSYDDQLQSVRRALMLFEKLGDVGEQAIARNILGLGLYTMARHTEALVEYQTALEINQRISNTRLEGTILANIGLVHWRERRYDEATQLFERSLRVRRSIGEPGVIGATLYSLGLVSRARGAYQRALDYYADALDHRRKAGDRQGEAQTLNGIGAVYADLGLPDRAIDLYQQALTIAEQIGYTAQIGFSNENIGANLVTLNRLREAEARQEAALLIWRKTNRRGALPATLSRLGAIRLLLGDSSGAREAITEALAIARDMGDRDTESRALLNLADVVVKTGDPQRALEMADQALDIARQIGGPQVEFLALASRGRALRALHRQPEAIEALRASIRIVNDLRAQIGSDLGKVGFIDQRQVAFDDLVDLLWSAGHREEGLEVAEASRARAFADLLMQRQVRTQRDQDTLTTLRDAVSQLPRAVGDVDRALVGLRAADQELASLVAVESPRAAEIRTLAIEHRLTFVEYLVGDERLFIWVIGPDGTIQSTAVAVSRERIDQLVSEIRRSIDADDLELLQHPQRLAPITRALHRHLIEPIRSWLPASALDPVVFVPNGPLALLPFAALTDQQGQPLVKRHTIAAAPAISVFRFTPAKRPSKRASTGPALVVADPRLPAGSGLQPLAGTRAEGATVARHLRRNDVMLLTGAAASEAAVKRSIGQRALVHFATHGLVSSERPLASSLLLSDGDGDDGYLRVDEVFGLDLRADLVVLSGCSTGLGRLTGDGIFGLSRAFIYAGTPSVVVTQWDVSDRATAFLMERFYAQLAAGRSKAAALRVAQLQTRERYPHPFLWAGFMLIGEPQ